MRAALSTPEERRTFLQTTAAGDDIDGAKLALALKCQRARNVGYDTDRRCAPCVDRDLAAPIALVALALLLA